MPTIRKGNKKASKAPIPLRRVPTFPKAYKDQFSSICGCAGPICGTTEPATVSEINDDLCVIRSSPWYRNSADEFSKALDANEMAAVTALIGAITGKDHPAIVLPYISDERGFQEDLGMFVNILLDTANPAFGSPSLPPTQVPVNVSPIGASRAAKESIRTATPTITSKSKTRKVAPLQPRNTNIILRSTERHRKPIRALGGKIFINTVAYRRCRALPLCT